MSIVIPTYDSAPWLPSTLVAIGEALSASTWRAEVIVVDDGSADDTPAVLERDWTFPLRVYRQENKGRFLARWAGVTMSSARGILVIDSRVIMDRDALRFLADATGHGADLVAYNGHVLTDDRTALVGRFWDVPVWLFWGGYLSSPRETRITPETFDSLPKGLTMFYSPREWLVSAMEAAWPATDPRLVSDDTKVIREIAVEHDLRISPGFAASYRPRESVRPFLLHAQVRGTLFVDSYAGTSPLRNAVLIALVLAPAILAGLLIVATLSGSAWLAVIVSALALLAILAPAVLAVIRRCPTRGVLAYVAFIVPFAGVFWLGLVRGVAVHRRAFRRGRRSTEGSSA